MTIRSVALPELPSPLTDLSHAAADGRWFGLCRNGAIVVLAGDWASAAVVVEIELPSEPGHKPWVSHQLRHLQGGDVLVHRTAWNRLDVSDPATGELLTPRGPTSWEAGEPRPENYHQLYGGRLHLSPDGLHLLNDGWVWQPIGIIQAWSLERWLTENVWESEDGQSGTFVDAREDWDYPMCWIGSRHIAIETVVLPDSSGGAGAIILDVLAPSTRAHRRPVRAKEVRRLTGPSGRFFSDGRRLFTAAADGLSIWDVRTGALLDDVADFRPQYQAASARTVLELSDEHVVLGTIPDD